ncbi:MAG: hypothetical protein OXQ84_09410, partial [bacterium]|nr:hypothetical protein [bacterium]
MVTIDALHTIRDTARTIVKSHGADYLMTIKGNAPRTFAALAGINWECDAEEACVKAHGRGVSEFPCQGRFVPDLIG